MESWGAFTTPAVLPDGDLELRHTDRQIGLHDPRVHLLLGDGITTNRQPIAVLDDPTGPGQALDRLEGRKIGVIRKRFKFDG